jgi:DHA1 family inner membrane transport protein
LYAVGRQASSAVLLAMVASTLMFSATPFLLGPISEEFGVGRGLAGGISVVQVGVFAIVNLAVPRMVSPSQNLYRIALGAMVVSGLLSAWTGSFWLLLVFRAFAGAGAGVLTWLAWADAMRFERSMAAVSAIGPIVALVGAPLFAFVAESGVDAVYTVLAAAAVPGLFARLELLEGSRPIRQRSRSRSNRVLLFALALMTFSGASLFVYESVAATEVLGMSATATSFAFSLNAGDGLLGARYSRSHVVPGRWMASIAVGAFLTIWGGSPFWFYVGMFWWGFAFWMSVPGVLQMLAERSLARDERAGDAQALMAFGRAGGPIMGGAFVDAGSFQGLAVAASLGIAASGAIVMGVQEGRDRLPVTDGRVIST